nr:RNA-directed DNA polymerase, eukaryota, reverse transcriptase zinc-binding domain protein [Tanacetum cinerariifolium]
MQCVSTAAFTLNINGTGLVTSKVREDLVSRVCFVDDLLVMCHGDTTSVGVIKKALDEFSACSGLHPNHSKSTVFFGSMKEEECSAISVILPFVTGKLPVRYLGVPLIAKRLVLESIHVYWASVFLLPTSYITYRDLYDRRLASCLTINEMITNGEWKWPFEWHQKFLMIICLTDADIDDKIVWKTNGGMTTDFTVSIANQDLNRQSPMVPWRKLERNNKIFKDSKRSSEEIFKNIVDVIKNKLSGIKVKDSKVVSDVEKMWKISCKRTTQKT